MEPIKRLLPQLSSSMRKGNCGRLGVAGGSGEYTGAPYFAAISMLKLGADLAHVFTPPEAAPVIKGYSPELIVHPSLQSSFEWLPRMDALLVGPGLGRSNESLHFVPSLLNSAAKENKRTVVDADGLFAVTESWPNITFPPITILTPNAVELDRLANKVLGQSTLGHPLDQIIPVAEALSNKLSVSLLVKGPSDIFVEPGQSASLFSHPGSLRRPGGIGDVLSGVLTVFLFWSKGTSPSPMRSASEAASLFTRECARRAFSVEGRSMMATDVITHIPSLLREIDAHRSGQL